MDAPGRLPYVAGNRYDPFSGSQREAHGKEQIRRALRRGWETPLPDLELEVRTIEITGNNARSRWTCRSPALPGPVDGIDNYTIVDGKITRLEVVIEPADGSAPPDPTARCDWLAILLLP